MYNKHIHIAANYKGVYFYYPLHNAAVYDVSRNLTV